MFAFLQTQIRNSKLEHSEVDAGKSGRAIAGDPEVYVSPLFAGMTDAASFNFDFRFSPASGAYFAAGMLSARAIRARPSS